MGSVAPVPCTPGSIAPQARYEAAISRAGNYTSAAEYATLASCEPCAAGKYQDDPGGRECKTCKKGGYCGAGAPVPTLCPAGYYGDKGLGEDGDEDLPALVNVTDCTGCENGTSCPLGSVVQTRCTPGTYADNSAATAAERHVCHKCPDGTYQDSQGMTECKPCETGNYCLEGAAAGRPCEAGTYNPRRGVGAGDHTQGEGGCVPTDPGFYAKTVSSSAIVGSSAIVSSRANGFYAKTVS